MKPKHKICIVTGAAQGNGRATGRSLPARARSPALATSPPQPSMPPWPAGITKDARLTKVTLAQSDAVIDVNLRGVFHRSQAVAGAMVRRAGGVILDASFIVGIRGNFGQTNHAASRFGVIGFTTTWSRALGPKGIQVNAVAPGFNETPILGTAPDTVLHQMREPVPIGRLGHRDEIANVYAFLASDEASHVNGAVLEVSGGMTV